MSQKELDKLVSDALKHHQVPPSKNAWERVAAGLDQKKSKGPQKDNSKRRLAWWFLALAAAGTLAYLLLQHWGQEVVMPRVGQNEAYWAYTSLEASEGVKKGLEAIEELDESKHQPIMLSRGEEEAEDALGQNPVLVSEEALPMGMRDATEEYSRKATALDISRRNQKKTEKLPMLTIQRNPIPRQALKPPEKRVSVRVEITIPYRGSKGGKPAAEPRRGINWQKVWRNILEE